MSTLKTNNVQVGQSVTATNNFTLYQPSVPDGTVRLGVGNSGATTADVITANSSGNVGIGTSTPQRKLDVTVSDTTTAQLYLRNNNASYASGMIVYNAGGEASMFRHNGGSDTSYAGANSVNIGSVTNNVVGFIQNNGEAARFDTNKNLLVGTTSSSVDCRVHIYKTVTSGDVLRVQNASGSTGVAYVGFRYGTGTGTETGYISTNGTSTTYSTTSDYRLKEDVQPMAGALAKVAALKPCTYKWKATGELGEGFIAHELAEVVSDAVTGEKDAVNEDGSIKPQGIDTSFLVATLTAAIQEQQSLITSLTARIAALEGAAS